MLERNNKQLIVWLVKLNGPQLEHFCDSNIRSMYKLGKQIPCSYFNIFEFYYFLSHIYRLKSKPVYIALLKGLYNSNKPNTVLYRSVEVVNCLLF